MVLSQPGSRGTLANTMKTIFLYYISSQNAQRREILFIINRLMIEWIYIHVISSNFKED